jgi:ABC-type lipoprotein export system ATPase subunit
MKAHRIGLSFSRINQPSKVVFHGLSFELPTKGLVVITGDSGMGKTSLLGIISGQKKPSKGNLIYPSGWKKNPPLYLEDQLFLVPSWHINDFIVKPETNEYLNQLGLPLHSRKKRFKELSGGQKIRVMVALFFSQASACYLLDEPTHALDDELRMNMIEFLTKQATHQLIVVATHDTELIAQANHELKIQSVYASRWIDYQFNAGTSHQEIKPSHHRMRKHWLNKLFWLHRSQWLGFTLTLASMVIHLGLLFTGVTSHTLLQQTQRYVALDKLEPFLTIQEVQATDIFDSPFQLVKSQAPDPQQLSFALSMIPDARVMTSIAEWFPTSIQIQEFTFEIRFIDIPYQEDAISVVWIHPHIPLPTYLDLSLIQLPESMPSFSYGKDMNIIDQRPIQSWFEPPQILLSYWQWLHVLQSNTATVNGEVMSFFSIYQTMYPPASVLVHDPRGIVESILNTNPHHHAWTLTRAIEKTYQLKHLLLDSVVVLTQCVFIGLWILGLFVWSTRLHWIYQNHHDQWRWLMLLHLSIKKIWQAISLKTFLSGFITLGIVQWIFFILINTWDVMPGSTLVNTLVIGWVLYLLQQTSRFMMLHWYAHA